MSKNNFRLLIVVSLVLAVVSGLYDFIWPDPITEKVIDYAYELEPETEESDLIYYGVIAIADTVFAIVSLIGLLLFKSWARHLYLAGFILFMPLYPFMGVTVYGGFNQMFYDISMLMSGAILALMYFSPVANYFQKQDLTSQGSRAASPPAA